MKRILFLLLVFTSLISYGQATFTNSGGAYTYTQDFNTLTTSTTAVTWTDNSSIANVYGQRTGNGTTIIANNGGGTGGTLYSYGTTAAVDRSLGSIGSSNAAAGSFVYGIRIKNNTGSTMYSLQVSYVGEQWRNSAAAAQTVAFSYNTSSTAFSSVSLSAGTTLPTGFVAVTGLDFTSPKTGGTAGALDGNLAANKVSISGNIIFDTPLPVDGEIILRWNDPDHSGTDHGLSIDDLSLTAGLTPIPTLIVTPTSLNNINYLFNNGPSGASSFTVSGANLSPANDMLTITAPANFEVSNNETTGFGATTTIPYINGSLSATSVYVRLASGLAAGTYGGATTYVVASGGTASSVNIAVSGTVTTGNECGTPLTIASVRSTIPAQAAYTGTAGTVLDGTITGIFGANKFYISDATGGIAIFTTGIVTNNSLKLGDRVKLTGTTARFNGEAEIITVTCISRISAGTVPAPKVFDANNPAGIVLGDFLAANEGDLVKIISANLNASGTFSTGQNYSIISCNDQGGFEIRIDAAATTLAGFAVPTVTQDITGVLGHYITTDGGTDKLQLYPRNPNDFVNSTVTCTLSSGGSNGCGVATITDNAQTLDVITWNLEWLGHPANGPSQSGAGDATQIANAKIVLNSIGADVYMLEEICSYNSSNPADNTTAFGKLLEGLNTTFGSGAYSGECSPAVSGSVVDANPQRVCIIYKNSVVEKISGRVMFDGFTPATYPPTGTPSQFWASGRKPYIFKAKVTLNSVVDTINFVGLHAKSGSDVTSYTRRKYDVKAMYDTLQAQYPNTKVLIGGDINDDVDVSIYPNNISSYSPFLYTNPDETNINGTRPNPDFDPVTKALSDIRCASTASYPDIIDHFILSNEMKTGVAKFNYKSGSASNMHPYSLITNYTTTTSDHFPVLIRLSSQPCPTKPVITASSLNICGSGSVTLSVTGCNGSLNWTGGLSGSSITVSPTINTNYRVACTAVDCTSDSSDVATVTVNPIPTKPSITPSSVSICSGSSTILTASACDGGTLNWTGGLTGSAITVSPIATKGYKVACTIIGCTSDSSDVANVTVNPIPTKPSITPSSVSICSGSSTILTASACDGGTLNWTGGLTGSAITVSPIATKGYKVACTIIGCTSDSSDVATVTVNPIPTKPTITPNSTLICGGGSITLFANGCSNGTLNWTGGLASSSITVSPTSTKEYKAACTINGCTSDSSNVSTVTVRPKPTKPVISPSSPSICIGNSITLTSTACDGGILNWTDNLYGTSITVSPTVTKDYKVACMIMGCVSDSSDAVTVIVKPIPTAPTLSANPTSITLGQSSSLTATGCTGILTWSLGGSTANPLTVTPNSTTTYTTTCTVNGCISAASTGVTVTVTSAEPCQSQLTLISTADDYTSGVQLKQASITNGKITATNKITGNAITIYQAKIIELNAGFKADAGTVFKAEIGGCN